VPSRPALRHPVGRGFRKVRPAGSESPASGLSAAMACEHTRRHDDLAKAAAEREPDRRRGSRSLSLAPSLQRQALPPCAPSFSRPRGAMIASWTPCEPLLCWWARPCPVGAVLLASARGSRHPIAAPKERGPRTPRSLSPAKRPLLVTTRRGHHPFVGPRSSRHVTREKAVPGCGSTSGVILALWVDPAERKPSASTCRRWRRTSPAGTRSSRPSTTRALGGRADPDAGDVREFVDLRLRHLLHLLRGHIAFHGGFDVLPHEALVIGA
jgi:hypothetical protein